MKSPEVERVLSEIGYGEVGPHVHHTNYACITVILRPGAKGRRPAAKKMWWLKLTSGLPITLVSRSVSRSLFSMKGPRKAGTQVDALIAGAGTQVVTKLFSPDLEVLKEKVAEIEGVLSGIEGVADLRTEQFASQTQVQIRMKRDQIARHGLNTYDVQRAIHDVIG